MAHQPVIDNQAIADNISRTVDKAALRKVRNLVDNFEHDEKAQKAQQFSVMFWFLAGLIVLAICASIISTKLIGKPLKEQYKASAQNAKASFEARSMERQLAALERDMRAAQPGIDATELAARVASFKPILEVSVKKECR